jgi:predicted NBD/HSP70 family sugar kinase
MTGVEAEARPPEILAADFGGSLMRLQLFAGNQALTDTVKTGPALEYDEALEAVREWAAETLPAVSDKSLAELDAVGVAVAGEVKDGRIVRAGRLQQRGWLDQAIQADLAQRLGIDQTERVVVVNDTYAIAKSQQRANNVQQVAENGYVLFISTGFGGAGFTPDQVIADEPGHQPYKPGLTCTCGQDGHVEAYIGAQAFEERFGVRPGDGKQLSPAQWEIVNRDTLAVIISLIERHAANGFDFDRLYFGGRIPGHAQFLRGLQSGLLRAQSEGRRQLKIPKIFHHTTEGDKSELVGARLVAQAYLADSHPA